MINNFLLSSLTGGRISLCLNGVEVSLQNQRILTLLFLGSPEKLRGPTQPAAIPKFLKRAAPVSFLLF